MIESGLTDILNQLKRYNFDVRETNPEENVSENEGFIAVKDGVTVSYDGQLFINNEPVRTPWGEFDVTIEEHVSWFLQNQDTIITNTSKAHQHTSRGSVVDAVK